MDKGEKELAEQPRHTKVLKLHILKPSGDMTWKELLELLREARYRVFRLANLAVSEAYLNFHQKRISPDFNSKRQTIGQLNRALREMLEQEGKKNNDRFSKNGALPDTVASALSRYRLHPLTSKKKWSEVLRGNISLPTFRRDMAIPVRCDKPGQKRLEKTNDGQVEVDLMICTHPYPRVVLATQDKSLGDGARTILAHLLENKDQSKNGYRQRYFEIKEDKLSHKWFLLVSYDFPASTPSLSKERIVGVDLGISCPLYVAINNGYARLGWRQFHALAARIRAIQNQTIRRRREILRGGNTIISDDRARSGHGLKRKLLPIEKLQGRIDRAYTTINHQFSSAVIKFAKDHGAGMIQIEKLDGLKEILSGTFLGERWRYSELQQFIKYKAKENGIEVKEVNPQYTSQRCSQCGYINEQFTFNYRQEQRQKLGKPVPFTCPECKYEANADYNAARNLATLDIEQLIMRQLDKQGIKN